MATTHMYIPNQNPGPDMKPEPRRISKSSVSRTPASKVTKPQKPKRTSERTGLENRERAYIAASRRSDRSLEARIVSAQMASQVHKERTGRAFRITERDVLNEEMYEEEDEDRSMVVRMTKEYLANGPIPQEWLATNPRMLQHLQAQVAQRAALMASFGGSQMANPFPGYPRFQPNAMQNFTQPNMQPSPATMQSPQIPASYPQTHAAATFQSRQQPQQPAATTIPTNANFSLSSFQTSNGQLAGSQSWFLGQQTAPSTSSPSLSHGSPHSTNPPLQSPSIVAPTPTGPQSSHALLGGQDMPLFSTALAPNDQQLLHGLLDPSRPSTQMLMQGHERFPQSHSSLSYMANPSMGTDKVKDTTSAEIDFDTKPTPLPQQTPSTDTDSQGRVDWSIGGAFSANAGLNNGLSQGMLQPAGLTPQHEFTGFDFEDFFDYTGNQW
ncbi:hypothetical protein M011DRAFT_477190 [Sporormia fimetaria CBS 119925]|uniref:Uncharacterized protein n=1 Tax=Sporormia fimetaria CBS 119925 TaxID=1340428 RepID=A0A6A6VCX7_9PLEO|nr:hypothetical protein M011DRAFT_477190 [Sporormia fimetaria CBS 119925]